MATIDDFFVDMELVVHRITLPRFAAQQIAEVAIYDGRAHRVGETPPMYASESQETALAEFSHHHSYLVGSDVRHTTLVGRVRTLDATKQHILDTWPITVDELVDDDWTACQQFVAGVTRQGAQAVRLQSARHASGANIVVVRSAALGLFSEVDVTLRTL